MQQLGINLKEIMLSEKKLSSIDSIYIMFLKWKNYRDGKQITGSKARPRNVPISWDSWLGLDEVICAYHRAQYKRIVFHSGRLLLLLNSTPSVDRSRLSNNLAKWN